MFEMPGHIAFEAWRSSKMETEVQCSRVLNSSVHYDNDRTKEVTQLCGKDEMTRESARARESMRRTALASTQSRSVTWVAPNNTWEPYSRHGRIRPLSRVNNWAGIKKKRYLWAVGLLFFSSLPYTLLTSHPLLGFLPVFPFTLYLHLFQYWDISANTINYFVLWQTFAI